MKQQLNKMFDMHVRYWSGENKIARRYLSLSFLGHARADDLKRSIVDILSKDGVPLVKMLHIGCDGPSVNKSLKKQLNESIVQLGGKHSLTSEVAICMYCTMGSMLLSLVWKSLEESRLCLEYGPSPKFRSPITLERVNGISPNFNKMWGPSTPVDTTSHVT